MAWLGPLSERCLRLLVVAATLYGVALAAERLRVVLLAVGLAVVLAIFLRPLVRRLEARGASAGLAASLVLLGAVAVVGGAAAATVPPAVAELGDLDVGISGGLERVQDWLAGSAVGVGEADVAGFLERAEQEVRDNAGRIATGVVAGATLATEVLAGSALALVLLFFGLKDGPAIRRWLVALLPPGARADAEAIGQRALRTLGGYVRGVSLVALFDAAFIALALVLVGVPLVVPLAVLTFLGAYVPIVGAFVAGIAAVLVALVTGGVLDAALVAAR